MSEKPIHFIVVEIDGEPDPDDPNIFDVQHRVECPGVTAGCLTWWECTKGEHDDEALWENPDAHGVEHQWIDGMWMAPGEPPRCLGHTMDVDFDGFDNPGRYPVQLEWDDGLYFIPVPSGGAA